MRQEVQWESLTPLSAIVQYQKPPCHSSIVVRQGVDMTTALVLPLWLTPTHGGWCMHDNHMVSQMLSIPLSLFLFFSALHFQLKLCELMSQFKHVKTILHCLLSQRLEQRCTSRTFTSSIGVQSSCKLSTVSERTSTHCQRESTNFFLFSSSLRHADFILL